MRAKTLKQDSHLKYRVSMCERAIFDDSDLQAFVYHSLLGRGFLCSAKLGHILDEYRGNIIDARKLDLPRKVVLDLIDRKIFISSDCQEMDLFKTQGINTRIRHLRLCIAESCNMNCTYCYVDCHKETSKMPYDVAETAIRNFKKILEENHGEGVITFFGGEPLLNWEVLQKSVILIRAFDPTSRYFSSVTVVTNGTLLERKKVEFLKKHNIRISISFDGPKEVNDKVRIMKNGEGSYDRIINGINVIKDSKYTLSSLVCTIGGHNIDSMKDVIEFAANQKTFLNLNDAFAEPRHNVYDAESVKKLPNNIFDAEIFAQRNNYKIDGTWKWPFNRVLSSRPYLRHCSASGGELSIDAKGNIKPCPGFDVSYGNVLDMKAALNSETYKRFCKRVAPNIPECNGCDIEGLCGGGCMLNASKCHKGNIFKKGESCPLFRSIFKKLILNYLNRQAKELT